MFSFVQEWKYEIFFLHQICQPNIYWRTNMTRTNLSFPKTEQARGLCVDARPRNIKIRKHFIRHAQIEQCTSSMMPIVSPVIIVLSPLTRARDRVWLSIGFLNETFSTIISYGSGTLISKMRKKKRTARRAIYLYALQIQVRCAITSVLENGFAPYFLRPFAPTRLAICSKTKAHPRNQNLFFSVSSRITSGYWVPRTIYAVTEIGSPKCFLRTTFERSSVHISTSHVKTWNTKFDGIFVVKALVFFFFKLSPIIVT